MTSPPLLVWNLSIQDDWRGIDPTSASRTLGITRLKGNSQRVMDPLQEDLEAPACKRL
jgi:hypothetical protein